MGIVVIKGVIKDEFAPYHVPHNRDTFLYSFIQGKIFQYLRHQNYSTDENIFASFTSSYFSDEKMQAVLFLQEAYNSCAYNFEEHIQFFI